LNWRKWLAVGRKIIKTEIQEIAIHPIPFEIEDGGKD